MDIQQLVKAANQIGAYFAIYPDQEQARQEITRHLTNFWTPHMRAAIRDHVASGAAHDLSPLAAAAVQVLPPAAASSPR
ncbi:formate dehydrogenase subunit delta [Aromatoleum petrolei]|uniref:Formate dehydrogenase n=1 Tax=Aromatoleum petrolei TaxID=76116 RepID=A0ABX1MQA9_9RHOO|nr:formate dehydrogenase subunit delta [Aromatoleum petrolei]NMF87327.1 formate dehydrogenase [Aromatoleum petrolei]QTQ38574.1 Putative formate dehydrogenase, delta subunit [Aromatoleum petrolei]